MVSGCKRHRAAAAIVGAALFLTVQTSALAQLAEQIAARAVPSVRVKGKIDPSVRTVLKGHVPLAVRNAVDLDRPNV